MNTEYHYLQHKDTTDFLIMLSEFEKDGWVPNWDTYLLRFNEKGFCESVSIILKRTKP